MSTLTSSPSSVVLSPPAAGFSCYAHSSRSSKSPLFTTLSSSSSPTTARSYPAQGPREADHTPLYRSPRSTAKVQYADAGTQYSPEGLPPTARRDASSDGQDIVIQQPSSSTTTTVTDTRTPAKSEPSEPQPRVDPSNQTQNAARQTNLQMPERTDPVASVAFVTNRSKSSSVPVRIMPAQYQDCDAKELGGLIANMLMELIRLNDDIPLRDGKLTRFHSRAPPGISCHDYLARLIQHATLSPPILLSMVYYIDRLCSLYPAFTISSLTVHRFLITAATVASKGLSDSFWTNPTYARIGGISTSELATLELDFLQRVAWRIVPKPETLVEYYSSLVQRSEGYVLVGSEEERQLPTR